MDNNAYIVFSFILFFPTFVYMVSNWITLHRIWEGRVARDVEYFSQLTTLIIHALPTSVHKKICSRYNIINSINECQVFYVPLTAPVS